MGVYVFPAFGLHFFNTFTDIDWVKKGHKQKATTHNIHRPYFFLPCSLYLFSFLQLFLFDTFFLFTPPFLIHQIHDFNVDGGTENETLPFLLVRVAQLASFQFFCISFVPKFPSSLHKVLFVTFSLLPFQIILLHRYNSYVQAPHLLASFTLILTSKPPCLTELGAWALVNDLSPHLSPSSKTRFSLFPKPDRYPYAAYALLSLVTRTLCLMPRLFNSLPICTWAKLYL